MSGIGHPHLHTRTPTQSTPIMCEFINKNKKGTDGGKRPIAIPSRKANLVRNFQICKKGLKSWQDGLWRGKPESGSGSEAPRPKYPSIRIRLGGSSMS